MLKIIWVIAIIFLIFNAVYFSIRFKFIQFNIYRIFKSFLNSSKNTPNSFKNLTVSLAAKIGVGSLAGIAIAIYYGGPGSVFWIWIIGIITSINTYCETYLGLTFQKKISTNYYGGPSYYIKYGLNNKLLSKIYAFLVIITYIFGFITIQSNTISICFSKYFDINIVLIGILLMIIVFFSISKGLDTISTITNIIVPIMGIIYIFSSIYIIIFNYNEIPSVFKSILFNAFNIKASLGGVFSSLIIGTQRAIFSTESGIGTSSIATSSTFCKNKTEYSLMQIVGIYFTIFIICTPTALLILTSKYTSYFTSTILNGIELTQYALNYHLGYFGNIILLLLVFFLAYSTIIAGYYYGESNLIFLNIKNRFLKITTCLLVFFGSVIKSSSLWIFVDFFVAILAIINIYSIIKLKKLIVIDNNSKNM